MLSTEFKLGKIAGVEISFTPTAIIGTLILWAILSGIAFWYLRLSPAKAVAGGLAAAILHLVADLWHQLGHAWAGRSAGHPMIGSRFGFLGVFSTDVYPANEEPLPPQIHIRRALGGPLGSLILSVIAALAFVVIDNARGSGLIWWLSLFFLADNFFVLTLQVLLPLRFNDGSTILYWLRHRQTKS